ncbi:MAG: glycosyltransferase [Gammaproteobacteria bacterium]|nr:glycosyltransferase [Gammaproteobacteria bacterium]
MIRIFLGYDSREVIAHHVCAQSIIETSRMPLSITPLKLDNLSSIFDRSREPDQLTDFSYTRFLVPYLCDYKGWAIYLDGDMLIREDIQRLWDLKDERYAVSVVKHADRKGHHTFLDTTVSLFPKFNWSSVMLFNNEKCKALTSDYLLTVRYQDLHQFKWLNDEKDIGALPSRWNHLVGYDKPNADVALVHWTLGGPYFDEHKNTEFAEEWFAMRDKMLKLLPE